MLKFVEEYGSGEGSIGQGASNTYKGIVTGDPVADNADDPGTVVTFALAHFSGTSQFGTIANNLAWNHLGPGIWEVICTYVPPDFSRATGQSEFSFTTGGGKQHITTSRQTVSSYAPEGETAPDYQGLIGVTDTSVDGLDIDVPIFAFKTTFYLPPASMSKSFVQLIYKLTGRVNSSVVNLTVNGVSLTFQPGELRFLYGEGRERAGFGDWELTFYWEALGNDTNIPVGPYTVEKYGWDYMWVSYKWTTSNNHLVQIPEFVYIERIYDFQDLNPLLIPTGLDPQQIQSWRTPQISDTTVVT